MQYLDHDRLVDALSVAGKFLTVWPLDDNAGRLQVICYETVWWIYMVNCATLAPSMAAGVYYYLDDLVNVMKSIVEMTYMSEMCFNLIYCRCNRTKLKKLLAERDRLHVSLTKREKVYRETYMQCTTVVYALITLIFVAGALIFILSPLVMPHRLIPLNTIYPITIEEFWGRSVVYALNVFAIMEATAAIIVDMIVIMIIWNASFKFHLLRMKVKTVLTARQLRERIKEHQVALGYVSEMNEAITCIIVKSIWAICIYIISCSLLVFRNVPLFEMTQFFLITFLSAIRLFVCSWSGQIMTDTAYNIALSLYNVNLINGCRKLRHDLIIIHKRCQRPVTISLFGFISALSLSYCAGVFYTTFKYFTTLRAIFKM